MAEKDTQELEKVVKTVKYELTEFTGALKEGKGKIKGGFDELFGGGGPIGLLANEVANIGKKAKAFGDIIGGTKDILLSPFKGFQSEEKKKEKAQKKDTEARRENTEKVEDLTDEIKKLNKANKKKANMVGVSGYGEAGDNDGLLTAGLFANTIGNLARGAGGLVGGLLPMLISAVGLGTLFALNKAGNRDISEMPGDLQDYYRKNAEKFDNSITTLQELINTITKGTTNDALNVYETNPDVVKSDKRSKNIRVTVTDVTDGEETVKIDGTGDGNGNNDVEIQIKPGQEANMTIDTFSSGGPTGNQTTGGLDGKGGRLAIVHGNEYIMNQRTLDSALRHIKGDQRTYDPQTNRFFSKKLGYYVNIDPTNLALYEQMMMYESLATSLKAPDIFKQLPPVLNQDGTINFDRYEAMDRTLLGITQDRLMADPSSYVKYGTQSGSVMLPDILNPNTLFGLASGPGELSLFGESEGVRLIASELLKLPFPAPSESYGTFPNTKMRGNVASATSTSPVGRPFETSKGTSVFIKSVDATTGARYTEKKFTARRDVIQPGGKTKILDASGKPITQQAIIQDRIKMKLKKLAPGFGGYLNLANIGFGSYEAYEIAVQLGTNEAEMQGLIQDFYLGGYFGDPDSEDAKRLRDGAMSLLKVRTNEMQITEFLRTPLNVGTGITAFSLAAGAEFRSGLKEINPKEIYKNPRLLITPSSAMKKNPFGFFLIPLGKGMLASYLAAGLSDHIINILQMQDVGRRHQELLEISDEDFAKIDQVFTLTGAFEEQPSLLEYFRMLHRQRAEIKLLKMKPELGNQFRITRASYGDSGMPYFDQSQTPIAISALNYKSLRDFGFVRGRDDLGLSATYMITDAEGKNTTIYHNGKRMTLEEFNALPPEDKIPPSMRPLSDVERNFIKMSGLTEKEYRIRYKSQNKIPSLNPNDRGYDTSLPVLIDQSQQPTTINVNPSQIGTTNQYLNESKLN